jgi:TolB-like protein/class 3 adenylate cyclase
LRYNGGEEKRRVPDQSVKRKLAAIFAADVAGYSRLMGADETGTVARLKASRLIVDRLIGEHRGRIFNTAGDSVVADFASAVDAVSCAVAVQGVLAQENAPQSAAEKMQFRIGVHVGDVIVDGTDLLGDGVNIAARLQALADPGGVCISAAARDHIGDNVAVAFGDLGEQRVKNIANPIRAYRVGPLQPRPHAGETPAVQSPLPLPEKPSIAVLPFTNLSGDPEQEYFADGMVEEIITALSRIRWLFVIARNSSFTYKGQRTDANRVGRELGIRYVLEGSVRRASDRVRITAQLIEATSGAQLWADRFEGSLDDIFELQDRVAGSIAGVIEPTLQSAEVRYASENRTRDPTVYDLYLRALAGVSTYTPEWIRHALDLLDQAIVREPNYGPALALAASYRVDLDNFGGEDASENRRAAVDLARRALRAGADDPRVLGRAAMVLGRFADDIDSALSLIDRALALNPSYADGWYHSGWLRIFAGELDLATEHFEISMRFNPRDRRGFHLGGIGTALFLGRRFDEAVATLRVSLEELPNFTPTYRALAASYALLGRHEEARAIAERLRSLDAVVVPSIGAFRNPEHAALFADGLRAVGEGG